jgi:hypothetical protein
VPPIPPECYQVTAEPPVPDLAGPGVVYVLGLVDVGRTVDSWPVVPVRLRLRRALKTLLRQYGLKCVDFRELRVNRPDRAG